jgi:hypothetical protein
LPITPHVKGADERRSIGSSMTRANVRFGFAVLFISAALTSLAAASATRLTLDLNGDGRPDTVLLTQSKSAVDIVIYFGNAAYKPEHFRFPVDSGREDAVCRVPVKLYAESLDYDAASVAGGPISGFVRSKASKGFAIVDEACDSIHFFWNHRTKHMDWWRE